MWPLIGSLETQALHIGILFLLISLFANVLRSILNNPRALQWIGWVAMLCSFASLVVSLVQRSMTAQYFALSNMYESLLVLILWMQVAFLVVDAKLKHPIFAWPTALLLLTALAYDTTLSQAIHPLQAALQSYWRSIHVPLIISSYAMFTLAFITSIVRLTMPEKILRTPNGLGSVAPLDNGTLFDELTYRFVSIGFPLLAIGIILGGLWANEAWGNYWSWDPKESMSLVTLLGYGVYLHLRVNREHSPKVLAWVSVVGFILMLITYFGVNLMGIGLHSYGKIA